VVLEGGRIVESGNHDQLMALDGRYARMFDLQARYYADGESEYSEYAETGSAETGNAETGYAAMAYDDEGAEFEADFS
jgi:ATP-binding cassette subfamily B protein